MSRARRVVGLYGDPSVTWSIMLDLVLRDVADADAVSRRLHDLVRRCPSLGPPPALERFAPERGPEVLTGYANTPYEVGGSVFRVALTTDGLRLVVAAHHGAMDGIGMLTTAAVLLDDDLRSSARGATATAPTGSFLGRSLARVVEAVARPPERFRGSGGARAADGDWVLAAPVVANRLDTATLAAAATRTMAGWNGTDHLPRAVVAVGVSSRRAGEEPLPDRRTGFVRLRAPGPWTPDVARELLRTSSPEPDFPATRGLGLAPLAVRVLSRRLGSSVLVSNLGRVQAGPGVLSVSVYPAASGPSGVAIGLATCAGTSMLTIRARRRSFGTTQAQALLRLLVEHVSEVR